MKPTDLDDENTIGRLLDAEWLTALEAAAYAGNIGVSTIREACSRSELRHVQIGGTQCGPIKTRKKEWIDQWLHRWTHGGHPSGDPTPGLDDARLTLRLAQAADVLDMPRHDHLIVGDAGRYLSFREAGTHTAT